MGELLHYNYMNRQEVRPMTQHEFLVLSRLAARATYNFAHVRPNASSEERKNLEDKAAALNAACRICAQYIEREGDNGE